MSGDAYIFSTLNLRRCQDAAKEQCAWRDAAKEQTRYSPGAYFLTWFILSHDRNWVTQKYLPVSMSSLCFPIIWYIKTVPFTAFHLLKCLFLCHCRRAKASNTYMMWQSSNVLRMSIQCVSSIIPRVWTSWWLCLKSTRRTHNTTEDAVHTLPRLLHLYLHGSILHQGHSTLGLLSLSLDYATYWAWATMETTQDTKERWGSHREARRIDPQISDLFSS